MSSTDPLSLAFGALADPTRRAILARLAQGEASVGELAAPHAMSMAAVSKHIKVLEQAGLIGRRKQAQFSYCTLIAGPLGDVRAWLDAYQHFKDETLDQFEAYLAALQKGAPDTRQ